MCHTISVDIKQGKSIILIGTNLLLTLLIRIENGSKNKRKHYHEFFEKSSTNLHLNLNCLTCGECLEQLKDIV